MQKLLLAVREERISLIIATIFFLIGVVLGCTNTQTLNQFLNEAGIFKQLQEVVKEVSQNPSFFNVFTVILTNNVLAALSVVLLGSLFGVIPLFFMLTNGMILGVVLMNTSQEAAVHPLFLFVTMILPHGFLEIPAAILAAAFGLTIGVTVWRSILSLFAPRLRQGIKWEWRSLWYRFPTLLLGIFILMVIAAAIEASLIVWVKVP